MKELLLLVAIGLGSTAGCSKGKEPEPKREPERPRRIEAPPRGVRAFPPFAIRSDGIGPYKLGATVRQLLDQLPSGPRITQFALPGVIQRDIVRAEDDAILIGAEPQGKATFVSVVRSDIARTEAGIHVGSSRAELERALGAPLADPEQALDPHVVIPSNMKNARVLLDDSDHIVGIVITAEPERAKPSAGEPRETTVTWNDDMLTVLQGDKALAPPIRLPGLVFARPLRNPKDGVDDYVAITRMEDGQVKAWSLAAFRLHDGKLAPIIKTPTLLYSLSAADARWIGADIRDIELYLELTSRADSIDVGGLLTTRNGDKIRDIAVITTTVSVPRTRARPVHEPTDAGTSDAH